MTEASAVSRSTPASIASAARMASAMATSTRAAASLASLTASCTLSSTCCMRLGPSGLEAAMAASRAAVTVSVLDNGITGVTRERAANAAFLPCGDLSDGAP